MPQEYSLNPSPARSQYRTYDSLSPSKKLYGMLLNSSYTDINIVIENEETAVGQLQLRLLGTTNFSILGTGKLAIL